MARTKNKGNTCQEIIISNPVAKFRFMSLVPLQGVQRETSGMKWVKVDNEDTK